MFDGVINNTPLSRYSKERLQNSKNYQEENRGRITHSIVEGYFPKFFKAVFFFQENQRLQMQLFEYVLENNCPK